LDRDWLVREEVHGIERGRETFEVEVGEVVEQWHDFVCSCEKCEKRKIEGEK
jgi:hypothetical protein